MSNAYIQSEIIHEMYFLANWIKAVAGREKNCAFFHTRTIPELMGGETGMNFSPG